MVETPDGSARSRLTHIGKYEVLQQLGAGGMGVVYRCIDRRIGREVAIKMLHGDYANQPEMLARFYEEGRHTGQLNHPNIVTVYDVGDENGMPYIVMECVEGNPLDKLVPRFEEIPLEDRLRIIVEICEALGYAHSRKVIHRDVKPANIFVLPNGRAKLLDFGIARPEVREEGMQLTRTGFLIGTVAYMAPERLRALPCDGRSDIFAIGIVLFELLTGRPPFCGEQAAVISMLMFEPHAALTCVRGDLPPGLECIVDRALAKAPEDRYATAEEMAADLNQVIASLRREPERQTQLDSGVSPAAVRRAGEESTLSQLDDVLASASALLEKGDLDQALHLLKTQPESVRGAVRAEEAIAAMEDLRLQAVYRTLGRAYAALDGSVPGSHGLMQNAQTASDLSNLGGAWNAAFQTREQMVAGQVVEEVLQRAASTEASAGSKQTKALLLSIASVVPYCSQEVQTLWQQAQERLSKSR
jgi:serine/threonine protein kinase